MTDAPHPDVVALRRDLAGRYALFTRTNMPAGCLLPWHLAVLDAGEGAQATLRLGLDENSGPGGAWSARDIAGVAQQRQMAEAQRKPSLMALQSSDHLGKVVEALGARPGQGMAAPLSFRPGDGPSPYPWDIVQRGGATRSPIILSSDPTGRSQGIIASLLLLVLDQMLIDAALARPADSLIALASSHATTALRCEVARRQHQA
ncbi:hypothetical protein [Teichococcus oryzae]|uniref:Uncharacterized protein n=1 Tax=Teichococcus oryzae TaxID=1608942 RepID=A0A5B2TFE5_9PROT|nr:hypothetical protein [Pseudoroseomonas oryzae]KAA2213201.1 hypothetical protein F0Q34_11245 [Pseudoroseomonas oryzae]